jgi:hypothetical protein
VGGVARAADRDLAHPGDRPVELADPLPVPVGAQERLLGDVLGGKVATGQGEGEPDDPAELP